MTNSGDYFKVPCEIKWRVKSLNPQEFNEKAKSGVALGHLASFRSDLDTQLRSTSLKGPEKVLMEKAFELLMSIENRLDRVEEFISTLSKESTSSFVPYQSSLIELGAAGFILQEQEWKGPMECLEVEMLLPAVPEYRLRVLVRQVQRVGGFWHFRFEALALDDEEAVHRYIRQRERELLRSRSQK